MSVGLDLGDGAAGHLDGGGADLVEAGGAAWQRVLVVTHPLSPIARHRPTDSRAR